jgi:hypothetical protein
VRRNRPSAGDPDFLAPVGPRVVVTLCDGAGPKIRRRCESAGIALDDFLAAVRIPNAGRPDREELDEAHLGRIRRWVRLRTADGRRTLYRVALVVLEHADAEQPGKVEVITAFREDG